MLGNEDVLALFAVLRAAQPDRVQLRSSGVQLAGELQQ